MKLGLIARADNSGLGNQTLEFYRHMMPDRTMVVDISKLNGNPIFPERYPDAQIVNGFPNDGTVREFLQGLDVVFIAEAAYNQRLYAIAKTLGVKTANQYNYEFFEWFNAPAEFLPDMFIAPSKWHYEDVQKICDERGIKHVYLHCPVDRKKLPFREIKQAKTFLHTAGKSAAHDRNGTKTVIEASLFINSDVKILIHFQGEQGLAHQATHSIQAYRDHAEQIGANVEIMQVEYDNYEEVYKQGDVLLLPRRYGGNCLPLNEALSTGMPVIMTDIQPNNSFLPDGWLTPAVWIDQFWPRTQVDIYGTAPRDLAAKIDWFAGLDEQQMLAENKTADALAHGISWEVMAPKYREELEKLCQT